MAKKFLFLGKIGLLLLLILLAVNRLPTTYAAATTAPILLITNSAYATNPFGNYLGEILRAEGLNEYDQADLSSISSTQLAQYTVVILADTTLTSAQATTFSNYVNAGGRLIAMHPDPQLAAVFGLGASAGAQQTDGYLKISPTAQINGETSGQGLYTDTMQIHGLSERFTPLAGATVVATLYSDAVTATAYPAITYNVYGSGQAIAFLYDLAKNVVYTRQGNPANANVDVDGDGVFRTIDLFQKQGGGAGWVDLNKVPVPQADMQQRLFARLIKEIRNTGGPLPQLWYFPNSAKTMLVMTGDAHANPTSYFQNEITSINKYNGKITFYLAIGSSPAPSDVLNWLPQGHTFGIHPYAYQPNTYQPYNITNLQQGYSVYYNWFTTTYSVAPYNIPMSLTVRNHQVAWAGWTDSADYAATYGIAMDTSFYDWGAWLKKPDGTWPHGYITGSGQPMKFARSDGSLVPVYQQLTQLIDEQLLGDVSPNLENLTAAQAIPVSQQVIDASLGGNYAALMTQNHVDYYGFGDPQTWAEGTMSYANSKGVPIWNADSWLKFTQTRHDAAISNVTWDETGGVLSYALTASPSGNFNLTLSAPWNYNGKVLTGALVDNANTTVSQQTINGFSVGFINVTAGSHTVSVFYGTPPATLTPTSTPIPPTATNTPTATATSLPPTATLTPTTTATPSATSAFTSTATSTPTATNTPVPPTATSTGTVTPFPTQTSTPISTPGVNLVLSSSADFAPSCALISGAHVSDVGGGAVALAATEADDFTGAALDPTKWSAGNWNGSAYSPTFSNSVMSIAASGGAWVRSVPTYTHGTLEAIALFGNAAYQHIGYGSDGFSGNRYFLFSTYTGDGNLYARVNNNVSEQNLNLGPIPVGMHHYRIEWRAADTSNDLVVFYIDGTQVASFTVTNVGATGFYAYMSNSSATVPLQVDALQSTPPYTSSGSYLSCVYDAGQTNNWQSIAWDPSVPAGTGASVQVRTSNDNSSWTGWTGVSTASGSVLPAPARYVQFQFALTTTDLTLTPLVNSVTLTGAAVATATPTSTSLPPTPTFTPTATVTPLPTATNTLLPTATNTSLPTATNTDLPTATATPIPTATDTVIPTATNTPVPTATDTVVPTATNTLLPTATNTPLPTATNTPLPTATNTVLPTATNTPLPTATNTPTPTPVPTLADSIFSSSFETGNFSEWTSAATNSGNLGVSSNARLVGNYGMQAVISNNNPMRVYDASPASETTYRARFYFSPNSLSMRSNDTHVIFTASSGATTIIRWQMRFNNNGQYQLQGSTLLNSGSFSSTGWLTISNAPHYIELSWVSASTTSSTDGSMQWWIDGQLRATQSGLANGLYRIDDEYLGPQAGIDSTTRGTEFFDAFVSRRFTYIGP